MKAEIYSFSLSCFMTWYTTIYPFYFEKLYGLFTGFFGHYRWCCLKSAARWTLQGTATQIYRAKPFLGKIILIAFALANLMGVNWHFLESSICIFLIRKVVKDLFICLLSMYVFSFARVAFSLSFSYLFLGVLCVLDSNPTLVVCYKYLILFCIILLYL